MMLTGTASIGIRVARQLWRKRNTTSVTSTIASSSVFDHLLDRGGDERRGVERDWSRSPRPGKLLASSFIRATTASFTLSALAPGRR